MICCLQEELAALSSYIIRENVSIVNADAAKSRISV
jgi:hypothetical protein